MSNSNDKWWGNQNDQGHETTVYGDTTECHLCGKQWDTNDPYPPKCLSEHERVQKNSLNWISKLRKQMRTK